MSDSFVELNGTNFSPSGAKFEITKGLVDAIQQEESYCELVQCLRDGKAELIVFDTEVQLAQRIKNEIRDTERIAIRVFEDGRMPEVLALRIGFPQVPHLILTSSEFPKQLCLYDQIWAEVKRIWTPTSFLDRIRTWLSLTATGELHGDDQPLEPLVMGASGKIIIPSDLATRELGEEMLSVHCVDDTKLDSIFVASYTSKEDIGQGLLILPLRIQCPSRTHGVIKFRPESICQIAEFCNSADFDFLLNVRNEILQAKEAYENSNCQDQFYASKILFLVSIPKKRHSDSGKESTDVRAFFSLETVKEIGKFVGAWGLHDGDVAAYLPSSQSSNVDACDACPPESDIELEMYNVVSNLSRKSSAYLTRFL